MNTWPAMVSSRLLLFSPAIFMLVAVVVGQPAFDLNCSSGESDCTAKRTSDACFQHRLRRSSPSSYSNGSARVHLRSPHSNGSRRSLSHAAAAPGFYNTCTGEDSDIVYGQALCRGYVSSTVYPYDSVHQHYIIDYSTPFNTSGKFINRRYFASNKTYKVFDKMTKRETRTEETNSEIPLFIDS
ncbi:uncharacterized protein LOC122276581 [Carya illinoinensis]|uniref:uncharacterized protein LOC122276581 n=1 Tax=Carya illinoinensis TaxID=32201 RepID=UPI001C71A1EA|nr:uncharacterized protein LOC122276581 [Carya illinoinensis]